MNQASVDAVTVALKALQGVHPRISAAVLSSVGGRVHGTTAVSVVERVQLSAMGAASLAIAHKGIHDLHFGDLQQVQILGESGSVVLMRVGAHAVLTLVISDVVSLEPIISEAKRTAHRLESLVPAS